MGDVTPVPGEPDTRTDARHMARHEHAQREEHALFRRLICHRDERARDELVRRFLPLARSLALRYRRSSEPFDDLVQVASLGLLKAIDRFDPQRGFAFTSFAVPTIVGELKRYFRDRTWAVRPPRNLQELALRAEQATGDLTQKLDRAPTVGELAEALEVDDEQVLEALQARGAHSALSLDAPPADDRDPRAIADAIGDDDGDYVRVEARVVLDGLLATLTRREREILRLRFEEDLTQAEIGARVGISQMHVSRILRSATAQLRRLAEHREDEALLVG